MNLFHYSYLANFVIFHAFMHIYLATSEYLCWAYNMQFAVTHTDGSCGGWFTSVCLFVFPHDDSKNNAAMITKLDIEMFHPGNIASWSLHSCKCWLLIVLLLHCLHVHLMIVDRFSSPKSIKVTRVSAGILYVPPYRIRLQLFSF